MQLTGKKDVNAGQPDIRSPTELGLCEDICEAAEDFFDGILDRMKEIDAKDSMSSRTKSTIDQLSDSLEELHDRNVETLKDLGAERLEPRKRKSREQLEPNRMHRMCHILWSENSPRENPTDKPFDEFRGGL